MNFIDRTLSDATLLWDYLRLNQVPIKSDIALVLGGHDISVADQTLILFNNKLIDKIIISGGGLNIPFGFLDNSVKTEAEAIASYLFDANIPETSVLVEKRAKNTGENFIFSYEQLKNNKVIFETCIVITKPYAERRALATGNKQWPNVNLRISSVDTCLEDYLLSGIPKHKILSMMVGEIQRLECYHLLDYTTYQEIPLRVSEASKRLEEDGYIERTLL